MAAPAQESQWLKIFLAIFVALSVILGVTCYFFYGYYTEAAGQAEAAKKSESDAKAATVATRGEYADLRRRVLPEGDKYDQHDKLLAAMKAEEDKMKGELTALGTEIQAFITKAKGVGATDADIAKFNELANTNIKQLLELPNPTYANYVSRLVELLRNETNLAGAFAADNIKLRTDYLSVDQTSASTIKLADEKKEQAEQQLAAETDKFNRTMEDQRKQLDTLQTALSKALSDKSDVERDFRLAREDWEGKARQYGVELRDLHRARELKETVLDVPDGRITYVDYNRNEVHVDLTRRTGARPQMRFVVFDKTAPGLPTEKPKAKIELMIVGDRDSVASIVPLTAFDKAEYGDDTIRAGDLIYSPVWSPNDPTQVALIGRIDLNQDGRDDRGFLIKMIEVAGGRVVYDLPPPGRGKERGQITSKVAYYVVDDRPAVNTLPGSRDESQDATAEETQEFEAKKTAAIRVAETYGVRPVPIKRFLRTLGYSHGMTLPGGRVEAIDRVTSESLLNPKGIGGDQPRPGGDAEGNGGMDEDAEDKDQ